jgi:hypothetical protein
MTELVAGIHDVIHSPSTPADGPTAVIYLRVSTKEQTEKPRSVQTPHANTGGHTGVPKFENDDENRFFTWHLFG